MLWEEDRNDPQSQQLENLMRWALNLPPVHVGGESYYPYLGVSAHGLALIYYTILQAKKRQETLSKAQVADEETLITVFPRLRDSSASTQQASTDPHDYRRFEPHIDEFAKYVNCLSKDMETAGRRHRAAAP